MRLPHHAMDTKNTANTAKGRPVEVLTPSKAIEPLLRLGRCQKVQDEVRTLKHTGRQRYCKTKDSSKTSAENEHTGVEAPNRKTGQSAHQEEGNPQSNDPSHNVVIEGVLFVSQNLAHHHDRHDLEALGQHLLYHIRHHAKHPAVQVVNCYLTVARNQVHDDFIFGTVSLEIHFFSTRLVPATNSKQAARSLGMICDAGLPFPASTSKGRSGMLLSLGPNSCCGPSRH